METQNALQAAIALFRQGSHTQSLERISQLLDDDPHAGKAWELKGLIEDALSWENRAIHSLETATTLVPLSASGQYVLAKNYLEIGKTDLAKSVFTLLLQREDIPDRLLPALSTYLGRQTGLVHLALEACRKAARRDPDQGDSWLGMAHFMSLLGYPQIQVANVLRKAVCIDPENRHYRLALSQQLKRMGEHDKAYQVVKQIPLSELKQISSLDCLERLLTIFQDANDQLRYEICFYKLRQLKSSDSCGPDLSERFKAKTPPRRIRR